VDRKVRGVPQRGQNARVPCAEDWKLAGSPLVKRKSPEATVNHATKGAALVRRQIEQWQQVSCRAAPCAR
jgi:hypothetical protein